MPARGDRYLQIRISRNTSIAIIFSLLVHLLLLIALAPQLLPDDEKQSKVQSEITVNLAPPPSGKTTMVEPAPAPAEPVAEPQPAKPPKPGRPKVVPVTPKPDSSTNKIIALEKPAPNSVRSPFDQRIPAPTPPAPDAPTDMQSYIAANRAKRQAEQGYTPQDSAEIANSNAPVSENARRDANIMRNLQQSSGANGIWDIRAKNLHTAQLSFNIQKPGDFKARQLLINVQTEADDDIDRAIAKKLIDLMKEYYPGELTYHSISLGREVQISPSSFNSAWVESLILKDVQAHSAR